MGTRASSRGPHQADRVAPFDGSAARDRRFVQVPVAGYHAVTVVDDNRFAQQAFRPDKGHHPIPFEIFVPSYHGQQSYPALLRDRAQHGADLSSNLHSVLIRVIS